jgi:putative copper export protein
MSRSRCSPRPEQSTPYSWPAGSRRCSDTPYGRLLAVKIILFLAMVVVALINRFRLMPRISRDVAALGALGRTVALEQVLGLLILAVVSVLGTLPPGVHGVGH